MCKKRVRKNEGRLQPNSRRERDLLRKRSGSRSSEAVFFVKKCGKSKGLPWCGARVLRGIN